MNADLIQLIDLVFAGFVAVLLTAVGFVAAERLRARQARRAQEFAELNGTERDDA